MILEVVAYGSASMLNTVLNGVAMLANGGGGYSIVSLAKLGMLASLLMVGFGAVFSQKLEVQKLLAGVMFFYMMFIPTTHVSIYDPYSGNTKLVANVPIGVGAPMAIITQTGRWLTEGFELAYWEPDAKFDRGYLNSLQVLMKARDARAPIDIPLERSIRSYVETCVFYNMQDEFDPPNKITEDKLLNAPDMWAAMETYYINRDTKVYLIDHVNGHQATCANAYALISNRFDDPMFRSDWDKYLKTVIGSQDDSPTATADEQIQSALNLLNHVSADSQTYMMNALIGNLYKCETAQECSMLTQAQEQRRIQWGMEHSTFQQVARPIMAFTESLVPALAPIMALLATLSPIGVSMIVKYFLALMWISMWQPLMALVNMYIAHAASSDLARYTDSGMDLASYSGITNSWTTVADWISVGGMLAASVPVIAGMVVMGASVAAGKMSGFAQGAPGSGEASSSATPALNKVSPVHSHGALQSSSPGVTLDAKGTMQAGANAAAAGTIADVASKAASATSVRSAALTAATLQTESARSAFMSTASDMISKEASQMRATGDFANWQNSNTAMKATTDRLSNQHGWSAKQGHEMAMAAQAALALMNGGQIDRSGAEELMRKHASKIGIRSQVDGRLTGKAGASGSLDKAITSLLDSALTDQTASTSARGGGVTDTTTTGSRQVAAKIAQSQQAKDYSLAKSRQEEAKQQYQEAAVWSQGVTQQSNYDMPTLAGVMGRTPQVGKDIESLANANLTGKQLDSARNGLRALGIYGHNGSRDNIDPNLVRAKALMDNGHGAGLLNILRNHGLVRPKNDPTNLAATDNKHLAQLSPGLPQERADAVGALAESGGRKALQQNQGHAAPDPATGLPVQQQPSPASNAQPSSSRPGGVDRPTPATPGSGASNSNSRSPDNPSIDDIHARFNQERFDPSRAQQRLEAGADRQAVTDYKPSDSTAQAGEKLVRSANTGAALEAGSRAASIVAEDISKLSAGQKLALGGAAAATLVAPTVASAIGGALATTEGRKAVGAALKSIATKRGAAFAAAGAMTATGVGAAAGGVMTIGAIALTAKDLNDLYKTMQQQAAKPSTSNKS